jgi:hypothetical protein
MTKLFAFLLGLIWLVPILLAALGIVVSSRVCSGQWIVHSLVLAAIALMLPAALYLQGVIDPTTVEYPGPGDGFMVFL